MKICFSHVRKASLYTKINQLRYDTYSQKYQGTPGQDSRPKGRGFESHRRHCVVSVSKNINPSLVLVQPRKTRPFITERLLMGRKESKQTNKQTPGQVLNALMASLLPCRAFVCLLLAEHPWKRIVQRANYQAFISVSQCAKP